MMVSALPENLNLKHIYKVFSFSSALSAGSYGSESVTFDEVVGNFSDSTCVSVAIASGRTSASNGTQITVLSMDTVSGSHPRLRFTYYVPQTHSQTVSYTFHIWYL